MLGTLGKFCIDSSLPLTVFSATTSLALFLLEFLEEVFCAGLAATSVTPSGPSAGLEGFDEDCRLCCGRWAYETACAEAALGAAVQTIVAGCAVKAARRTEEENILYCKI